MAAAFYSFTYATLSTARPIPAASMTKSGQSSQGDSVDPGISKKRRGRQPRQSLLNPNLYNAIASFTSAITRPVIQPGGFRDFTGWLNSISSLQYEGPWIKLSKSFLKESDSFEAEDVSQLKKDVVVEIMNTVVERKPEESSKLVSTNARRQCASAPSRTTVMTIFESYLNELVTGRSSGSSPESSRPVRGSDAATSRSPSMNRGCSARESSVGRRAACAASKESSSRGRSGSSGARAGSSGMEISSLLSNDLHQVRGSSSGSNLPSLSVFDEQIRTRKENEKWTRRH